MSFQELQFSFRQKLKLPVILQDETTECAHACVAMVSQYFGHAIDLRAIRKMCPPNGRGMNALAIHQLLDTLHLKPRALRVPLEEIGFIQCPAIIHWEMNHFVVLKQVKKNAVIIHDPAFGERTCSLTEFSAAFTGIIIEVDKASDFKAIYDQQTLTLHALLQSFQGIHHIIAVLLLLSLTVELCALLNPLFLQFVTDQVIGFHDMNNLTLFAAGFILLIAFQVFTEYARGNLVIYISHHITAQFSAFVAEHLLKLPLSFFENRHKGDILSKFQSIDQIQKKISVDLISAILDGLMIILTITAMLIYSVGLTGIVLMVQALYLILRHASFQHLKKQTETAVLQHARAASVFLETLQGILSIKSFLAERLRFNTWRNRYISALNADIQTAKMNLIYHTASQFLLHIEHVIIIAYGAVLVLRHQFSLGMLLAFLSFRLTMVTKTASLIQNIFDYRLISIQLQRLSDILFQQTELLQTQPLSTVPAQGALSLSNVSFTYQNNTPNILHHINLNIQAGEKVAITGPSGCGKSTLLKVMMGLLEKTDGNIYIDGIPVQDFGLLNYRAITASVMQEDHLFSGSILDNIAFFTDDVDIERIHHAAQLAHIHEMIAALPMRYETLVGDMGSTLSGGQKQRILLARALYKQPKILFLDEATSHLDIDHEKKINTALSALNITQIIIAHRQETINMADRVVRLKCYAKS